jgi:hypothetical protein
MPSSANAGHIPRRLDFQPWPGFKGRQREWLSPEKIVEAADREPELVQRDTARLAG